MAEKLCIKYGGGRGYSRSLIWTNPSPTSAYPGWSPITDSGFSGYDYLEFEYRFSTSDSGSRSVIVPIENFNTKADGTFFFGFSEQVNASNPTRLVYKHDSTKISITDACNWGTTTNNNSALIPINIYGLKE